jgi:hypothetical protein
MRFDASRPVPWMRLARLFLVYAVIANVVFLLLFRDDFGWGVVVGTALGGLVYIGLSAFMVKLGWDPPQVRARANARQASEQRAAGTGGGSVTPETSRGRPAPTRRTNAGNRRARKR